METHRRPQFIFSKAVRLLLNVMYRNGIYYFLLHIDLVFLIRM